APRPQPAVALKTVPKPAARPVNALAASTTTSPPPSVPQAKPAVAVVALPAPPAAPRVDIATVKVRAVGVPTAAAARRPVDVPPSPTFAAPTFAAMAPKLDFKSPMATSGPERVSAPAPTSPPGATETVLSKSPASAASVRNPGTLDQQLAILTGSDGTPNRIEPSPAPDAMPDRPHDAFSPTSATMKAASGAPPSTLAAQAARLVRERDSAMPAPLAAPQRLGGPVAEAAEHEIEIGSFTSAIEAEQKMSRLRSEVEVLAGRTALAIPVEEQGRTVYKARFAGFDAGGARRACLELRRAAVDCFVTSPH
ncbi:MAG: SPOR domain-containing protein, partial [Hyphomicrobium sp.]